MRGERERERQGCALAPGSDWHHVADVPVCTCSVVARTGVLQGGSLLQSGKRVILQYCSETGPENALSGAARLFISTPGRRVHENGSLTPAHGIFGGRQLGRRRPIASPKPPFNGEARKPPAIPSTRRPRVRVPSRPAYSKTARAVCRPETRRAGAVARLPCGGIAGAAGSSGHDWLPGAARNLRSTRPGLGLAGLCRGRACRRGP